MSVFDFPKYGDEFFEREFGHYFEDSLPNYKRFWESFIAPLKRRPQGIGFRKNVDQRLRFMARAHYTMFRHLVSVHRFLEQVKISSDDMRFLFEPCLFHLGAATEMVETVLFAWGQIGRDIGISVENPQGFFRRVWNLLRALWDRNSFSGKPAGLQVAETQGVRELTLDEQLNVFINRKQYKRRLHDLSVKGRSVTITLHSKQDLIQSFLKKAGPDVKAAYNEFYGTSNKVRHYRNQVVHNPILGKVATRESLWVPQESKLQLYDEWSKVFNPLKVSDPGNSSYLTIQVASDSHSYPVPPSASATAGAEYPLPDPLFDDFVPAEELLADFLQQIEMSINALWEQIIPYCQQLTEHPDYQQLTGQPPMEDSDE